MKKLAISLLAIVALSTSFALPSTASAAVKSWKVSDVRVDDVVKSADRTTVYYITDNGRYGFPNGGVFLSWYKDFSNVKVIANEQLAMYPLRGQVAYRPGSQLVQFESSPEVFTVAKGGVLRHIANAKLARAIFGNAWAKKIRKFPASYRAAFKQGATLEKAADIDLALAMHGGENRIPSYCLVEMSPDFPAPLTSNQASITVMYR